MANFNLNITDLITEFGAYYEDRGQGEKDIRSQLFKTDDFSELFTLQPTDNDIYRTTYQTASSVLQGFVKRFTSKGGGAMEPWSQLLGHFKIDMKVAPDDYAESFIGFLANLKEVDRSQWPMIAYIIRTIILPKAKEENFTDVNYWGWKFTGEVASSPTVNGTSFVRQLTTAIIDAGVPPNSSADGIHTIIARMHAAGRLGAEVAMGAIPSDEEDFCSYVETMFADSSIHTELRKKIDYAMMSTELYKKYREGRRLKYNLAYRAEVNLDEIKDTNIMVRGSDAMFGSNQIWATPAFNRKLVRKSNNLGKFDVQKLDREVKLLSDWKENLALDYPEFVVVNDQDLTISAGLITTYYTPV